MTYGLQVFKASGALAYSTAGHRGITSGGTVALPWTSGVESSTFTFSWPQFAGRFGRAVTFCGGYLRVTQFSWTYPGGVPTLQITRVNALYGQQLTDTENVSIFFE